MTNKCVMMTKKISQMLITFRKNHLHILFLAVLLQSKPINIKIMFFDGDDESQDVKTKMARRHFLLEVLHYMYFAK